MCSTKNYVQTTASFTNAGQIRMKHVLWVSINIQDREMILKNVENHPGGLDNPPPYPVREHILISYKQTAPEFKKNILTFLLRIQIYKQYKKVLVYNFTGKM